ncbi:MAG: AsmA family protein [Bacteroidales bacterium]|nr:AsmA family protein [Bacteroidales bacterium]
MSYKKRKPSFSRLIKAALTTFLVLIGLLLFILVLFYINKDNIGRKIIAETSKRTNSVITFNDIHLSPFVQLPSVSVTLTNIKILEKKAFIDSLEKPIANIEALHAGINILELLKGHIDVSRITIEGGEFNLINDVDSSYNFIKAFSPSETDHIIHKQPKASESNNSNKFSKSEMDLSINQVYFKNVALNYHSKLSRKSAVAKIDVLKASFEYMPEIIKTTCRLQMDISDLQLSDQKNIQNISLGLKSSIHYDRERKTLSIDPSEMIVQEAKMNLKGIAQLNEKIKLDLELDGSDEDISFLKLFLTKPGIKNIKSGDVYFTASIIGFLYPEIPEVNCKFGVNNLNVKIPESNKTIQNLSINGHFNSGKKADLSQAYLKIDTISAQLPKGHINGLFYLEDFNSPHLDYTIDLKTDLKGFDAIFKINQLSDLSGTVQIKDQFTGHFIADSGWIRDSRNNISVLLDSISFNITDYHVSLLNGNLRGNLYTLDLFNLQIKTGNTDLQIDGSVFNISQFIKDEGKNISADLIISSSSFDLPEFLSFDPKIGESFPHKINEINMDVDISTTLYKLKNFKKVPEIKFNIKHLNADIENLFPPIKINQGIFILGEIDSLLHLDFNDFAIQVAGSYLNTSLDIFSPPDKALKLEIQLHAQELNPGKLFYYYKTDTIPKALNAMLTGGMACKLFFIKKTKSILNRLEFKTSKLSYSSSSDTIIIDSIQFYGRDIDYKHNANPLSKLTASFDLSARKIKTSHFKADSVYFGIEAIDGTYTITPEKVSLFGKEGTGKLVLSPFNEPPSYSIKYTVKQFQVEKFLESFKEKQALKGLVDFDLSLDFKGSDWLSIAPTLNGEAQLKGSNLNLEGIDIDEITKKFERTQHFTLVDIGAVIFAGPVGLAVTKGFDFTSLLVSNPEESSNILELYTDWNIQKGNLRMQDIAFTTPENRIAASGWINLGLDSLDITLALLNQKGCSILSQNIKGSIKDPKLDDVHVISKLLAPITNLVKSHKESDCIPFYTGIVKHPAQVKK